MCFSSNSCCWPACLCGRQPLSRPLLLAEAYGGQYQATYLVPFVAIAGAMRKEFGFPNYQVLCR